VRLDRGRAVAPALRQAVVELALLEHGIGEPNPAAHHDDDEKQQERVGDPAIARGLHVLLLPRLFGVVHVSHGSERMGAAEPSPRHQRVHARA
jgi:hypothetical protein